VRRGGAGAWQESGGDQVGEARRQPDQDRTLSDRRDHVGQPVSQLLVELEGYRLHAFQERVVASVADVVGLAGRVERGRGDG